MSYLLAFLFAVFGFVSTAFGDVNGTLDIDLSGVTYDVTQLELVAGLILAAYASAWVIARVLALVARGTYEKKWGAKSPSEWRRQVYREGDRDYIRHAKSKGWL